ncbi:hypothetical protein PSE10C_54290 [Pseudomonas amygdali pv. eriobotryae]|uniref:histidine kinase n=1 Tax=Pseudomonas amygdali pv. eriobotryae TaxID=129137 RepID=A0A9P3AKA0_PSEA0|nr:hypothetical protein PSE10A_58510 [Pseudomonas amygdali pv. eriobotryae]GFZ74687.1 hypothetical protein PSE10C_54290 [Pseudomonas amygdali pv. eriobotryae]
MHREVPIAEVLDNVHPEDRPGLDAAIIEAVARRGGYAHQYRVKRADGLYYWLQATGRVESNEHGEPVSFPGFVIDITERRAGQERLRISEELTRQSVERVQLALAAGAIVGTWNWDLRTDCFTVDQAFANAFGLDPALGRDGLPLAKIVETVHPDDRVGLIAAIDASIAHGGIYTHQYRVKRTDGKYYWLEASGRVDYALDGTPLTFPGVLIDIEGRLEVEAQRDRALHELRSLNETLEQRIAKRSEELMVAEERMRQSQKMEAIGQLTGGVAHDFNNLLTVIKSSTDLLKVPDLPVERRARYVKAISDTVERASKVTSQLLAFARRQTLTPEVFAACDSVRSLAGMLDTLVGSQIAIDIDLPDRAHYVKADLNQFDTALVNMAVNARDAMQKQGRLSIRVYATKQLPAVRNHPAIAGDYVAVSLSDTGSGISSEQLEQIFEPFFTTKGVGHGTGLGLSQVFGFAKQSGGEITVISEVDAGSIFTLYLPEVPKPPEKPKEDEPQPLMNGHGTGVLVVEDNLDVGNFAVQTLTDLGYRPVLAHNAQEALAELSQDSTRFDVVFTDVVMPGMSGIELGHEIRRLYHDLPVLLASGYSHVLAQNGTYGFELLHKPYSVEELSRLLRKVGIWQHRQRIFHKK